MSGVESEGWCFTVFQFELLNDIRCEKFKSPHNLKGIKEQEYNPLILSSMFIKVFWHILFLSFFLFCFLSIESLPAKNDTLTPTFQIALLSSFLL